MKKILSICLILALSLAIFPTAYADTSDETAFTVTLTISGASDTVDVTWDDAWFKTGATTYNHELAIASCALSGTAYSQESAVNALTALRFESIEPVYTTPTRLDSDVVSYTFGEKQISLDGGAYRLIVILVKGTSGDDEWYSNFNIGRDGEDHDGFSQAADKVLMDFRSYFEALDCEKENTLLLITGHSRGAAVANIIAARLTDSDYADKSNVYGYTFATPSTSQSASEEGYENIFNIVSGEDFVARVPIYNWGFGRYGVDLLLPSKSYYYNASELAQDMEELYEQLMGKSFKEYEGTLTIDQVIDKVYEMAPDVDAYYNQPQQGGRIVGDTLSGYFDLVAGLMSGQTEMLAVLALYSGDFSILNDFLTRSYANGTLECAHTVATYYGWLKAHTAEELFGSVQGTTRTSFKRVIIEGPLDVSVYDASGALAASVVNGRTDVDTLAVNTDDGTTTVDLPDGQTYSIKLTANGDGTGRCTFREISMVGTGETVSREVRVSKFTVSKDNALSASSDSYSLIRDDGTVLEPDYDSDDQIDFIDVDENAYYYDAVQWAVQKSITNGTGNGTFSPDAPCTRAQVVTFLWRAAGSPAPTSFDNPFTDVTDEAYYYNAVLWAVENGITNGKTGSEFGVDDVCDRGQIVTFLYRAAGNPELSASDNPFTDVTGDAYYYNAVLWAVDNGITNGTSGTTFSPGSSCDRGQVVTFLYRAQ